MCNDPQKKIRLLVFIHNKHINKVPRFAKTPFFLNQTFTFCLVSADKIFLIYTPYQTTTINLVINNKNMLQNKNLHSNNNQKPLQDVTTNTNQSNKPKNSENYYTNKHKEDLEKLTKIANSISKRLNRIHTFFSQTPNTEENANHTNTYNFFTLDNTTTYSYHNNPTNNSNSHFRNKHYLTNTSPKPYEIVVSEQEIKNKIHLYGNVRKKQENNKIFIQIELFPQQEINLTEHEITLGKSLQHPIEKEHKYMFRCPLTKCNHKPLNFYYIKTHLDQHFQHYHSSDDNIQFTVKFQQNQEWKTLRYPCFQK